jgi:uncharacterized membrane protein YsdA (DUF1294 family)
MGNPFQRFAVLSLGLSVAGGWALWHFTDLGPLPSWLVAITGSTFLTYGYDKLISMQNGTRVPEAVLLLLAFVGGTAGAIIGMHLFHHKTAKGSFRWKFWLLFALQVLLVSGYFIWLKPRLEA